MTPPRKGQSRPATGRRRSGSRLDQGLRRETGGSPSGGRAKLRRLLRGLRGRGAAAPAEDGVERRRQVPGLRVLAEVEEDALAPVDVGVELLDEALDRVQFLLARKGHQLGGDLRSLERRLVDLGEFTGGGRAGRQIALGGFGVSAGASRTCACTSVSLS